MNVKPGEGLSKDEAILYLVAGYDLNEPPGKAHQKKAAASFQDNFLQNDIAKNGPENWVKDIVSQGPLICEKYAAKVVAEKYQSDAERCI